MPEAFKYRAFLAYSYADAGMAKRVRDCLQGYHIDLELVGHVTRVGLVPKTLQPIFCNRIVFDGKSSIGAWTVSALDNSAALILLASPRSARSRFVNNQVRYFKTRHPERPVIPLIIDGAPDDPENDCFPSALRFAVVPNGADTAADVVPPDLRNKGDGFELAIAKVVARLTGLGTYDVHIRAQRERHRQGRTRNKIAAATAALAVVAGVFWWQSHLQSAARAEVAALVEKYSHLSPTAAAVPGARESLSEAINSIADGASIDRRYAEALEWLKAGKTIEAAPLLKAVAEDRVKRGARSAAAAYRTLASVAAVSDPGGARDYYGEAARLDPTDIEATFRHGWFQREAGHIEAAEAAYRSVITLAKASTDEWVLWAHLGKGDIERERGHLDDALATYREAGIIAKNLARADAANVGWQYDLGIANERIGDVLMRLGDHDLALRFYQVQQDVISRIASGNPGHADRQRDPTVPLIKVRNVAKQDHLSEALKSYRAGLAIMNRLAEADPSNAGWQRDLAASYDRVGNLLLAQDHLPDALDAYRAGVGVLESLVKDDPGNVRWQRDLAASLTKVGDLLVEQDDLPDALISYQASLAIADRLAKADPGNVRWQRDRSVTYSKVGDVLAEQGNLTKALKSYRTSLAVADRLVVPDTGKGDWQRDLSITHRGAGDVLKAQGDLPEATKSYQASIAIMDRLAKGDPGNAGWQHDLAVTYGAAADLLKAQGNLYEALRSYQASLAIMDRLTSADPDNAGWQRDLALTYSGVADVFKAHGNLPEALNSYQASLAIGERIAIADNGKADWQRDVAVTYVRLADFYRKSGQGPKAQEALTAARAIMARLVAKFPHQARWKQDFAWFDQQIAAVKN